MSSIVTALLAALSQAALAVFARLVTKSMFESLLEKVIIAGVTRLADETDSPLLDDVAAVVRKQLEQPPKP